MFSIFIHCSHINYFHTHHTGTFCFEVTHTSTQYGSENSWTLGTCSNTSPHVNHATANVECCLVPGEYTLECKDSYGDGWHGGYMTIQGVNYCTNFQTGSEEDHDIIIDPDIDDENPTGTLKKRQNVLTLD